ncbi:uncharacterized protein LOC129299582 isoform X2 [Prosopis cineraria]|uniref:uncharacterized protein LOC129299582 isoform X2 n=1 Tax=Prosopis cineraria TaxID=364024 RepID=UPI00240F4C16|nr:uncharacterized protein LOC129299582 isoform X2 [Prosopis cineraria]
MCVQGRRRAGVGNQNDLLPLVPLFNERRFHSERRRRRTKDHLPDLKRPLIKQQEPVNVDQWWHKHKARARKHTEFRDKLMDDLKRPYSEEEYWMLLKQLSEKKPVQSQRVLRSCTKSYDDDTRPPKSILDYHAEFISRRIVSTMGRCIMSGGAATIGRSHCI